MLESFFGQTYIDVYVTTFRLVLSLLLGGLIGLERERKRQSAGLRTHIMICLGSTLLMLTSIYIPQTFESFKNGDPGRIAAQVVSGIGFLGGGAIFRLGANIRGLTTAATIWIVAAIGLTIGAGAYGAAFVATILILFVLMVLDKVEDKYFPDLLIKVLQINFNTSKIETDHVFAILEKFGIKIQSVNISQSMDKKNSKMKLDIMIPHKLEYKKFYKELNGNIPNVTQISLGQGF